MLGSDTAANYRLTQLENDEEGNCGEKLKKRRTNLRISFLAVHMAALQRYKSALAWP